tara:strand:+ start:60 stop:197 length:138 start_codon:yes stop_codon:yes gene_type:complete
MSDKDNSNQEKEDEVLKRMLKTPPKPHKKAESSKKTSRESRKKIG